MSKLRYPKEILDFLRAEAMAAYPEEVCGMLSGMPGPRGTTLVGVHAMDNVYERHREADPQSYPRTARTAYLMDPARQAALARALDDAGTPIAGVYHSHVDVGAYFSEEDEAAALWDGEPLLPGVEYLVLSARETGVDAARAFHFDGEGFSGREVSLGGSRPSGTGRSRGTGTGSARRSSRRNSGDRR